LVLATGWAALAPFPDSRPPVLWQPANVALATTAIAWANRVNVSELKVLRIDDDIGWGIVPGENVGRF
jgi:hypothetical protein